MLQQLFKGQVLIRVMALATLLSGLLLSQQAAAQAALRVGMVPDAGATQVSVQEKAPLQAYLQKQLGRPVKLIIPTNYNATVEGLDNGSLDIAYLGGLTYVKAHARAQVIPLVQRKSDRDFHSLFITQANSDIHSLKDLRGKTFAFGDINSTSGHLMPYRAMLKAGINPDKDLASTRFTGSHPATIKAVAAGIVDAGACDQSVYHAMIKNHKVASSKLRVFYTTQPFVDYVWVARKGLQASTRRAVTNAFLSLKAGRGDDSKILSILRGKKFVKANNDEYDALRATAKKLGLFQ